MRINPPIKIMKILLVLPTLSAGGAEGFVTNLGVSLAELGEEVYFFLMAGVRGVRGKVLLKRLEQVGIEVIGAKERNVRSPMNLVRLVGLIRSWKPDIVQANLYPAEVLVAAAKALSIGTSTCYVRRLAGTEQLGNRSTKIVRMLDYVYRRTIACSNPVAMAYQDFVGMNHRSILVTIPNGGLLQQAVTTAEEKRQARAQLVLSSQLFIVAHIGRMIGDGNGLTGGLEKGPKAYDVLIRAFAKAFSGNPQCVLVMLGGGPLRPKVEALAENLGITKQVRFLGQQPEPWPVLKAADLFFFPSRYEGLPNVLPEAASCGLPVVASDIPEIRALYPGNAWLLFSKDNIAAFADGLLDIFTQHKEFRERASRLAPEIRRRFSMKICAHRYVDAYQNERLECER